MGRKHGFRGTPVKPSSRLSSVAGVFERRGDPLVSPREGQEKYGRNLETEDPDFDRYFAEKRMVEARFEKLASDLLKPSQVDKGNAFRSAISRSNYDPQRKAASIVAKMNAEIAKSTVDVKRKSGKPGVVKGSFYYFPDSEGKERDCDKVKPRPFSGQPVPNKKENKK